MSKTDEGSFEKLLIKLEIIQFSQNINMVSWFAELKNVRNIFL